MERIESLKNPRVKAAKALHTVKGRSRSGMFLCEGEHMVSEAVQAAAGHDLDLALSIGSAFAVDTIFVDEARLEQYQELIDDSVADHVYSVPEHVLAAISTVKSPQGIVAVVRLQEPQIMAREDFNAPGISPAAFGISTPSFAEGTASPFSAGEATQENDEALVDEGAAQDASGEDTAEGSDEDALMLGDRLVLLENVQDPGNVGTILRTMDAAGFDGAVLSPGCADPFSPKALRATMGSIFRVPAVQVQSAAGAAALLKADGYAVVAAALDGEDFFSRKPLPEKVCLIIGNEGAGITSETMAAATHRFRLPMKGGAESLNAAAAAAIFIYEIAYRN